MSSTSLPANSSPPASSNQSMPLSMRSAGGLGARSDAPLTSQLPAVHQQHLGGGGHLLRAQLELVLAAAGNRLDPRLEQPHQQLVLALHVAPQQRRARPLDDRRPRVAGADLELAVVEGQLGQQRRVGQHRGGVLGQHQARPRRRGLLRGAQLVGDLQPRQVGDLEQLGQGVLEVPLRDDDLARVAQQRDPVQLALRGRQAPDRVGEDGQRAAGSSRWAGSASGRSAARSRRCARACRTAWRRRPPPPGAASGARAGRCPRPAPCRRSAGGRPRSRARRPPPDERAPARAASAAGGTAGSGRSFFWPRRARLWRALAAVARTVITASPPVSSAGAPLGSSSRLSSSGSTPVRLSLPGLLPGPMRRVKTSRTSPSLLRLAAVLTRKRVLTAASAVAGAATTGVDRRSDLGAQRVELRSPGGGRMPRATAASPLRASRAAVALPRPPPRPPAPRGRPRDRPRRRRDPCAARPGPGPAGWMSGPWPATASSVAQTCSQGLPAAKRRHSQNACSARLDSTWDQSSPTA